jgi:hypothetical protein
MPYALNGGGHVISATTNNPFISNIRKSANLTRTKISSNKEKISHPHSEIIRREFGEMGRTNTLSSTNQLPKVSYSLKE